jgi:hypothetical protein
MTTSSNRRSLDAPDLDLDEFLADFVGSLAPVDTHCDPTADDRATSA